MILEDAKTTGPSPHGATTSVTAQCFQADIHNAANRTLQRCQRRSTRRCLRSTATLVGYEGSGTNANLALEKNTHVSATPAGC